jgi:ATP-dependent RNA helicase DBP3
VGIAATGSGKTIAFGLPGIVHVAARGVAQPKKPFMLVLAPTRELAVQTQQVCEAAGKCVNVRSVCVFGGVSKEPQQKALRMGVEIVVATPGRLMDLMKDGCVDLSCVSYVVLDEADRMLDLGFYPDLQKILPKTMKNRQTAMFSATWPTEVKNLAASFMKNAVRVTVGAHDLEARLLALLKQFSRLARDWNVVADELRFPPSQ